MPGGRPTAATPAMLEKAEEYLLTWVDKGQVIPSIEGLALHLGISRSILYDRKEFSDILERLRQAQALVLFTQGLSKNFDSTLTKLMLSKHGYIEKSAQDITSKGESLSVAPDPKQAAAYAQYLKDKS